MSACRTEGETRFESYLTEMCYPFEFEKEYPGKNKRPDYTLEMNGIFLFDVKDADGRARLRTFFPVPAYFSAMEFCDKENLNTILGHVLFGLYRETLIEGPFSFGSIEHIRKLYAGADSGGIVLSPSALGSDLFLWAHGRGDLTLGDFLNPAIELRSEVQIKTTPGIRSTVYPDRTFPRPGLANNS